MSRRASSALLAVAAVQALIAVLLYVRAGLVTDLWPLLDTTELTFVFLASILAAAAASIAWCAIVGEAGSVVGIGLDSLTIFVPVGAYAVWLLLGSGPDPWILVLAAIWGTLFGVGLLRYGLARPIEDPRPAPRPVLVAFAVVVVGLLLVGAALVAGVQDILPWRVTPEVSVIVGLSFLGAAAYFGYGLLRSSWLNAGGQLAGFLAYDLVLIGPFLLRLPSVPARWLPSLVVYVAVLLVSGVMGAWYLFVAPRTRMRWPPGRPG